MHLVCPHCTTSFAIDPAKLGQAGRTVRCSRCKEVWLARAEDVVQDAPVVAMAAADPAPADDLADDPGWGVTEDSPEAPVIDSPSIAAEIPKAADPFARRTDNDDDAEAPPLSSKRKRRRPAGLKGLIAAFRDDPLKAVKSVATAPAACVVFGSVALALLVWRAEVVRLLPQTAMFYRLIGYEVNLRALAFRDVKITRENVDAKPVLVIEGVIVGETAKTVDVPRLRFIVRDGRGTELYAWNAVLEQAALRPGERAWFRSRLASPPPDARSIDVRFFNRRDIAPGGA